MPMTRLFLSLAPRLRRAPQLAAVVALLGFTLAGTVALTAACTVADWLDPALAVAAGRPTHATGPARFLHRKPGKTLPELWNAELVDAEKHKQSVVVMFTADWCSPCQTIKDMAASSAAVQRTLKKGRLLFIDVDEWRGPAHALIPGVNPTKLPTLVRVDKYGKQVRLCFGTDLGLLSEDSVAHNLQRLFDGQAPEKPWYLGDPDKERELMRAQQAAKEKKAKSEPAVTISGKPGDRTVVIQNHDGPRRWFLLPYNADTGLDAKPQVTGWSTMRWTEHGRAEFLRFDGKPAFAAIAVTGYGSVSLEHWPMQGRGKKGAMEVWELNQLLVDGREPPPTQKAPYHLDIHQATAATAVQTGGAVKLGMHLRTKHTIRLR